MCTISLLFVSNGFSFSFSFGETTNILYSLRHTNVRQRPTWTWGGGGNGTTVRDVGAIKWSNRTHRILIQLHVQQTRWDLSHQCHSSRVQLVLQVLFAFLFRKMKQNLNVNSIDSKLYASVLTRYSCSSCCSRIFCSLSACASPSGQEIASVGLGSLYAAGGVSGSDRMLRRLRPVADADADCSFGGGLDAAEVEGCWCWAPIGGGGDGETLPFDEAGALASRSAWPDDVGMLCARPACTKSRRALAVAVAVACGGGAVVVVVVVVVALVLVLLPLPLL